MLVSFWRIVEVSVDFIYLSEIELKDTLALITFTVILSIVGPTVDKLSKSIICETLI